MLLIAKWPESTSPQGGSLVAANFASQTIWTGDNLEIMLGLNSASVDLIYLDPPFNSKRNYAAPIGSEAAGAAFKDTWTLSDVDEAWHGEIADREPALYSIIDAAGQAHGKGMKSYLIMMAVRLLEMRRLLKETGSVYLHCDPTASHYLKMLMDGIYGAGSFRNEISWKRTTGRSDGKRWGRVHDVLLFYAPSHNATWHNVYEPLGKEYVRKMYRHKDRRGIYRAHDLTAKGLNGGGYFYDFHGHPGPWRFPKNRMMELEADDLIYLPQKVGGMPCIKRYLVDSKGAKVNDVFDNISPVSGKVEKVGYPTQKPLALLERIIRASTNEGDVVLDPFCGCATACIAAEKLERQWVGIDISPKAADLVKLRLHKEVGMFWQGAHRTDVPHRTDLGELPNYRTHKHRLYGKQEGQCRGCRHMFPFRNMTVDHIVPQSKAGSDHLDNLQLLCSACNSMKGADSQEAFLARLRTAGIGG